MFAELLVSFCLGIAETLTPSTVTNIIANITSSSLLASSSSFSAKSQSLLPSGSVSLSTVKISSTSKVFSISSNHTFNTSSSTSYRKSSLPVSSSSVVTSSILSVNALDSSTISTISTSISKSGSSTISSAMTTSIISSSSIAVSKSMDNGTMSSAPVTSRTVSSRSRSTSTGSSRIPETFSSSDSVNSPSFSRSSSTKFPSSSISSASADLVAQASLIISQDHYGRFCSQYLGYQNLQGSVIYVTTVTIGTTVTVSVGTLTLSSEHTELNVQTVPTGSTTIVKTPTTTNEMTSTITETVATTRLFGVTTSASIDNAQGDRRANPPKTSVEKRALGDSILSVPPELTSFAPSVISSACSKNVVRPTMVGAQTVVSTVYSSHYVTVPAGYAVAVYTIQISSRLRSGIYSTTNTAAPNTITRTRTITATTYQTVLTTSTKVLFPSNIPAVYLANPTPIAGNANGALRPVDDEYFAVTLPFSMQLYDHSSPRIFVSSNGVSHHLVDIFQGAKCLMLPSGLVSRLWSWMSRLREPRSWLRSLRKRSIAYRGISR